MRSPHFCPFKFYYSRVNKSLQSVIINHIYIYIEIVRSGKFAFPRISARNSETFQGKTRGSFLSPIRKMEKTKSVETFINRQAPKGS